MIRTQTLGGWLEAVYLSDRIDITVGAAEQLRIAVRLFDRWLGRPSAFQDLTKVNLLAWMRWLSRSRAPSTVNSKRRGILAVWNAAGEAKLCPPPPRIAKLREPRRIPAAWTMQQVEQILRACNRLRGSWDGVPVRLCWRILVLICWDTGCRVGSVLNAETRHVDVHAQTWRVPAEDIKGRQADRLFALHPQTVAAIVQSRCRDRARLFPFPCGRRQLWLHLKRILYAAGLPADRTRMFHCFRRSAESHAAAERGISWAAAAIGHGVEVARKSYIAPTIYQAPALIEALPRPRVDI